MKACMKEKLDNKDFYDQMDEAMRTDITTKRNFVEDQIDFANLFDFVTYEFCDGDSDKVCEKLAEYFNQDYNNYCDCIASNWFAGDEYDE